MKQFEREIMLYEMIVDYLQANDFNPEEYDFWACIDEFINLIYRISEDILREVYNVD